MAYIQRHLQESVLELSKDYPVILIAGPRGAGKTTMLKKLMDTERSSSSTGTARFARVTATGAIERRTRRFVSLDNLMDRDMAKSDPALFLQVHKPPLLISEVQYAPELLPYIKEAIKNDKRPGDFWLTGSHLYELMDTAYTELAGDVALLNLFPLSTAEIAGENYPPFVVDRNTLASIQKKQIPAGDLFNQIWFGSSPKRHADAKSGSEDENSSAQEIWDNYYSNYIDTCIKRDVRDIGGSIDSLKFLRFVTATASHCGQMLNVKAIAEEAYIDQVTCKNWLGILANIGIIFYLHPFECPELKRMVKSPKLFFYDTGLVCYLTRWNSPEAALSGAMAGQLFECYVVSEIVKGYCHHGANPYIYYYRDRDGSEINFILKDGRILHPVQVELTGKPNKRMTSSFVHLTKAEQRVGTGAVICMAPKLKAINDTVYAVPVSFI